MNVQKGDAPLYTKNDRAEVKKFEKTPLGEKFIAAFLTDSGAYSTSKMKEVYKTSSIFSIRNPANLNKLFNQFVKDNYKK